MRINKLSERFIDRLFLGGYGIIRFKKFAITKTHTSYKYMLKELGWSIIGLPVLIIQWIIEVISKILDLIPNIHIVK